MAARIPRRSFASPFVITLAACGSGSPPPTGPTPPTSDPVIVANPPRPQPDPEPQAPPDGPKVDPVGDPPPKADRRWTITMAKAACTSFDAGACTFPDRKPGEPIRPCNPPPPHSYAPCPPGLVEGASLVVIQPAGRSFCEIERPKVNCPPVSVCNPPEPTRVPCPK